MESPASADANENVLLRLAQASGWHIRFKPARVPLLFFLMWYVLRCPPDTMLAYSRRPGLSALITREFLRWGKWRVVLGNDTIASQALVFYNPQVWRQKMLAAQMRASYPHADLILTPSDNAILELLADDARRAAMGQRAREFVLREYGIKVLEAYVACLIPADSAGQSETL